MASLDGFDANEHEPSRGFDLIPPGKYPALITASEVKETARGDGSYLALTLEIQGGELQGRKLWVNLNLWNPNPKAVQIAQADMSAICRAVGVLKPGDSTELHNLPMLITVGQKKRSDSPEMQNVIRKYEDPNAPPAQGAKPAAPKGPPPKAPWAKK